MTRQSREISSSPDYSPAGRADMFRRFVDGKSTDKYEVGHDDEWGDPSIGVGINKPHFAPGLTKAEIAGLMDALDDEARTLGGHRLGGWDPDSPVTSVIKSWRTGYSFEAEKQIHN